MRMRSPLKLMLSIVCMALVTLVTVPALAFSPRSGSGDGSSQKTKVTQVAQSSQSGETATQPEPTDGPAHAVPEPSAGLVFALGALLVAGATRRRARER